jgi:ribosome-binding factor A
VRTEKVAAAMRRALQEAIARVHDPRVRGLITVTGVDLSDDMREAVARISVLPESSQELTLHGLRSAAGMLRREVGDAVRIKRLPTLSFELDDSLKRQARVLSAIARVQPEASPEEPGASAPDPPDPPDPAPGPAPDEGAM